MDGSGLQHQRILRRAGNTLVFNGSNPDFFSIGRGELYGLCDAGSFAADWQHLWRNVCVAAHFFSAAAAQCLRLNECEVA